MEGYFELGHIAKLHGFKGEVSLFLDVTNSDSYLAISLVYLDIDGNATPFMITNRKLMNKGFMVVKFEGVNNEQQAQKLIRKKVYLPEVALQSLDEHSFYDHEIIGFQVIDRAYGPIGNVISVIDHASNPLLQIDNRGKEILVPLNLELDKIIDRDESKIWISTPDGLLDIYLT